MKLVMNNYGKWFKRRDMELMVTEKPRVLYVRNDLSIVAIPESVAMNFKSIDQIVRKVGPYLKRMMNA